MSDLLDDFKVLLVEYGNATFDCGEHEGTLEDYRAVREKADAAKLACIEWVNRHMSNKGSSGPAAAGGYAASAGCAPRSCSSASDLKGSF